MGKGCEGVWVRGRGWGCEVATHQPLTYNKWSQTHEKCRQLSDTGKLNSNCLLSTAVSSSYLTTQLRVIWKHAAFFNSSSTQHRHLAKSLQHSIGWPLYFSLQQICFYIIVVLNHDDTYWQKHHSASSIPSHHTRFSVIHTCFKIRVGINHHDNRKTFDDPVDNTYLWFIIPQLLNLCVLSSVTSEESCGSDKETAPSQTQWPLPHYPVMSHSHFMHHPIILLLLLLSLLFNVFHYNIIINSLMETTHK